MRDRRRTRRGAEARVPGWRSATRPVRRPVLLQPPDWYAKKVLAVAKAYTRLALVGQDHDVRGLDKRRGLLARFEAQLVGALAGDKGHQVVVPDLERYFGRGLSLDDLRDRAGQSVTGAQLHLVLLSRWPAVQALAREDTMAESTRSHARVLKTDHERLPLRHVPQASGEGSGQPHGALLARQRALQRGPLWGGPRPAATGGREQAGLLRGLQDAGSRPFRAAREPRSEKRFSEGQRGGAGKRGPPDREGDRRLYAPAGEARGGVAPDSANIPGVSEA